jgi:ATP-dependent DNA helicase RecG
LPYTGVGSGITRALDEDINVTFMNNDKAQEFVITVWREESNEVEKKVTKSRGKVTKSVTKSNKKVTKSRKKVTKSKTMTLDLDTLTLT